MSSAEAAMAAQYTARLIEFPSLELGGDYQAVVEQIERLPDGHLALETREFLGLSGQRLTAGFTEKYDDAKGRGNSGHHVYFGQLMLNSDHDHDLPTPVAVKPYNFDDESLPIKGHSLLPIEARALAHEWAANEYVSRLSQYERAYLPLGVWKDNAGKPQLLTLFDEQTQTFDNIFWAVGPDAQRIGRNKIIKALHLSLYALGVLHGAGLTHGDAQIKNFARDSKQVRFVDLEALDKLPADDGEVRMSIETHRQINADLNKFAASLVVHGDLPNDMFGKVSSVITDDRVVDAATRQYWAGLVQGGFRNGVWFPENLVLQPERLLDIFRFAVQLQRDTRAAIEAAKE